MPAAALHPAGLGLILLLAACTARPTVAPVPPVPRPEQPPAEAQGPSQADIRHARAERNRALNETAASAQAAGSGPDEMQRAYYRSIEGRLLAEGRMRRDRVPMDAPIDADSLVRDFVQIALRDEYSRSGDELIPDARSAPLRRWQAPVRLQLEFGASADSALRRAYHGEIADFAVQMQKASGHPVTLTGSGGNFFVLVLTEDERQTIGPRLQQLVPGLPAQDISALSQLDRDNLCSVFAYSQGSSAAYVRAIALLRAELPTRLRSSCIHEELAQGMGLANDSPAARPSVFNDDEEFALLTLHDELLLKILYDPRLRPGMTESEAVPIVRRIAGELLSQGS
ncbi:DUF2927 domain-containing protein [Paracoccus marinaquae]|uniref:DUF2927 domain-containing protein n=1 Tax=Paracoccus marinaquae TaxID=2841926 RepID=A0ABS6AI85_9RHOB|nr:DUF2927 domain-containing protein [Paracoccus marinaquae]MBU3029380.1 DUF2927 domain-containing protein [Paracoccus marinaquae]